MANLKAIKQGSASPVCRLFVDDPGWVTCEAVGNGEHVYTWEGGQIAAIQDDLVGPVMWLDNADALPWKLDWIEHDNVNSRWYIRRILQAQGKTYDRPI